MLGEQHCNELEFLLRGANPECWGKLQTGVLAAATVHDAGTGNPATGG